MNTTPTINYANKTIFTTESYLRAARVPFSTEFNELAELRAALPDFEVKVRSRRKPRTTPQTQNIPKFVSYKKIEAYLRLLPESEKLLARFEAVKAYAACHRNSASIVFKWFNESFPDYRKAPKLDENGKLIAAVNVVSLDAFKREKETNGINEQKEAM